MTGVIEDHDRTVLIPLQPAPPSTEDAGGYAPIAASAPVMGQHGARERALGQLACIMAGLVTAGVASLRVSWPGLWGDELATWGMTTVSWPQLGELLQRSDVVLAPYYALMHAWTAA